MKKLIILALVSTLGLLGLNAQSYFGARVGATVANVQETRDGLEIDTKAKVNLQIGALIDLGIFEWLSIQPELTYLGRTTEITEPITGIGVERSLSYLDLGALLKLRSNQDKALGGYIGAGPFVSYILNGQVKVGDTETDLDFGDNAYKRTDLSLAGALGVTFKIGGPVLFADARYIVGLGDLDNADKNEIKDRTIGLSAGLMVPIN